MQIRWALEYVESSTMFSKFGSWAKKISTYFYSPIQPFFVEYFLHYSLNMRLVTLSRSFAITARRVCAKTVERRIDDGDEDVDIMTMMTMIIIMMLLMMIVIRGYQDTTPFLPALLRKAPFVILSFFEPLLIVAVFMPNSYCIDGTCLCLTDSYSMVCKPPPDFLPAHSLKKPPKTAWPSVMQSLPSKTFLSN